MEITPKYNLTSAKDKIVVDDVPFGQKFGGLLANSSSIQQGSGNDIFMASEKGIHLGDAEFSDAPFSVDMQGNLRATSGTFSGDITGASGSFTGDISGATGTFTGRFKIGGLIINVVAGDSIQGAINEVNAAGGGTVVLGNGTHRPGGNITLYSSVNLEGQTQGGAIIDFENGAYGILAQGSNAYSTGTVTVAAGGTTVTGSGTTFTSAMIGRSILLSGIWYTVATFTSTTEVSISIPFADVALSGATYVIATILSDISIEKLTIKNSTSASINFQYVNEFYFERLKMITSTTAIQMQDCSNLTTDNIDFIYCGTALTATRCHFWTSSYCGDVDSTTKGFDLTSCTRFQIRSNFGLGSTGNGVTLTSCSVALVSLNAYRENAGKGIELVSGNSNIQISSNNVQANASDGIKLTATSDDCDVINNQLISNGGYGVNIAASSCDDNLLASNNYKSNTSGSIQDLGLGTNIY